MKQLKAPFPYFGAKSKVADIIWQALGDPAHYIEPCFGSGAALLARPNWSVGIDRTETVNDADGFIANVWRGIQFDPDTVAKWCDWPVNHACLIARKARLIREENYLLENLCKDDKWFDAELAGYWIWAAGCWIGSGLTRPNQIPHLSDKGKGVHAVPAIYDRFRQLSERLRRVRVVCGDWSRVCGGDWQDANWPTVGMFFDPPYAIKDRDTGVYGKHDSTTVGNDIRSWCIDRGSRENYRIVLAGYEEHAELLEHGWSSKAWKTQGGYGQTARNNKDSQGKANRGRETLYFSPHCIADKQLGLGI